MLKKIIVLSIFLSLIGTIQLKAFADDPLSVGAKAPTFRLPATGGQVVSLNDYVGRHHLVIVFYPADNTPGCTVQLCSLRDEIERFKALNTKIIASNPASVQSHEKFAQRQSYPFPILSDGERTMATAYKVNSFTGFNKRTVYIIDKQGVIRFSQRGMHSNDDLIKVIKQFKHAD